VPVEKLLAAHSGTMGALPPRRGELRMGYSPVVDGHVLPDHPFDPVATPLSAKIPLLIGCNQFETTLFYLADRSSFSLTDAALRSRVADIAGDEADRVIKAYQSAFPTDSSSDTFFRITADRIVRRSTITLAERKSQQHQAATYMYYFTWRSPALDGELGAPHTVEIPFVFDNTDVPKVMTRAPSAAALAQKTSNAWLSFARTGNPSHPGLPAWPAYTAQQRATMVFNDTCKVLNDPDPLGREV
jgi:para-nitrobenzyl esterase